MAPSATNTVKTPQNQASAPTTTTMNLSSPIVLNSVEYYPWPNAPAAAPPSIHTTFLDPSANPVNFEYRALVVIHGEPWATLDWDEYSQPVNLSEYTTEPTTYTTSLMPALNINNKPFVFDSGATCHVSPEKSDFKMLAPIPPQLVKGLGGSSIYAIGQGSIDFHVASGHTITLHNVLWNTESRQPQ
jgi:hypothetical protein